MRRLVTAGVRIGPLLAVALVACALAPAVAGATIFWASSLPTSALGRANHDGSAPNPAFISASNPVAVAVDAGHIYWANYNVDSIGRANLDGSNVNNFFIVGLNGPDAVAVDGGHIYWSNFGAPPGFGGTTIGRSNLDGTGVNQSFITGAQAPLGVAVDAGHVYWTNALPSSYSIGRANLDGSGANQNLITGLNGPRDMAVDSHFIYWASQYNHSIGRANLDGSGVNQYFINALPAPWGLAVDSGNVYWSTTADNLIGRSNLDGTAINPSFISGAGTPRGLAVNADPPLRGSLLRASTSGAVGSLTFACQGPPSKACQERVVITAKERRRGGTIIGVTARNKPKVKTVTVTVASASFAVLAGRTATVPITLNATGKRLLAQFFALTAKVTWSAPGSRAVTFRYPRINIDHKELIWTVVVGAYSQAYSLTVAPLPVGASVEVLCRGHGCPFARRRRATRSGQVVLTAVFGHSRLSPGTSVELIITAANHIGEDLVETMSATQTPLVKIRCLPPGYRHAVACHG